MSAIAVDLVAKIKSREAECRAGGPDPHLAMSGMIALGGLDLQHVVEQQASQLVGTEIMRVGAVPIRSSSSHRWR